MQSASVLQLRSIWTVPPGCPPVEPGRSITRGGVSVERGGGVSVSPPASPGSALMPAPAVAPGAVAGGWLADRWMRRTDRGRIYVSALGMSLIVPAMFGVGYAPQTGLLWVAIAFLLLFGLGWGFFDANNMPILCQIARPELRATGYGIMNLVSISCGGFADWGFGVLRDRHVPLVGIFGAFASAAVLSVVLVLLIRPRYREAEAPLIH